MNGLAPGTILDLNRDTTSSVRLAVNGRTVGEGELVEIDGKLGVRIGLEHLVSVFVWQTPPPDATQFSWVERLADVVASAGLRTCRGPGARFRCPADSSSELFGVSAANSGPVEVLARYTLEPRKNLYIVKVGTEMFLIASSESNIHFLTALNAADLGPHIENMRSLPTGSRDIGGILKGLQRFQRPKT